MNFLPYESFELYTKLSADEVFYRLRANVETKRRWLIFINKSYFGKVERENFKIQRITWGNRNFSPIVSGRISSDGTKTCVLFRMRMPWFSFFFYLIILMSIWFSYFGGISNLIIDKVQTGVWGIDSPVLLIMPIIMFLFAYGISVGSFMWDAQDIKKFLFRLLETNEENMKIDEKILGLTEPQILKLIFLITSVLSVGWILYNLFLKPSFLP